MTDTPPENHERVSHWDRPKPPHDWRWVVGGIGRTLIILGLLMFGFVAYQLWGTGIQTAQAQRKLEAQFEKLVSGTEATTTTTVVATSVPPTTDAVTTAPATVPVDSIVPTTTTEPAPPPARSIPELGQAVARLEIPRISLNRFVVEGATVEALTKGPGHFPETPLPGQLGNSAIAGHRTTYLHPFYEIDALQPGDEITVTTLNGHYVYSVTGTVVVSPEDYDAVIPTTDPTKATLTLVSCTPRYSASKRIVVRSELVADKSDPLTEPAPVTTGDPTSPADGTLPDEDTVVTSETVTETVANTVTDTVAAPVTTAPVTTAPAGGNPGVPSGPAAASPDAFADGWFSDAAAIPHALIWGLILAGIGYGMLRLSRKVRRYWVGVLAGLVPLMVVLYFFYENVNRLLPPNL